MEGQGKSSQISLKRAKANGVLPKQFLAMAEKAASKGVVSKRIPTNSNHPEIINSIFQEGNLVGTVQMIGIRVTLMWPLQIITPLAALYWIARLLGFRRERSQSRVGRVLRSTFRAIGVIELAFYLFYLYEAKRLSRRRARPPLLPTGKPLQVARRCLASVYDIQDGGALGRMQAVSRPRTPCLSPRLSPSSSSQDLMALLPNSATHELVNVEELLRSWSRKVEQGDTADLDFLNAVTDEADKKCFSQQPLQQADSADFHWDKLDQVQVLALKWAEVSGWFLGSNPVDLRLGNVEEWAAWAFFDVGSKSELPSYHQQELDEMVREIAEWAELDLPEGYNPLIKSMRLTVDPIPSQHRPLIYYIVTGYIMPIIQEVQLNRLGFESYKSGTISYWRRAGAQHADDRLSPPPLVFCHGIGISVLPYMHLLEDLINWDTEAPRREIFLLSMPNIAMRISSDAPSMAETVACVSDMLDSWNIPAAHFVGHSFGSATVAWMVKRAPSRVLAATFMDPVCFMLAKPDVSYNFMYRKASSPSQLLLHYFVSKELYISHSIARNFFWYQCILWPEEIPQGAPALVVLSGKDSIVPTYSVRRYLCAYIQKHPESDLEVMYFPTLGHGEINFGPRGARATGKILDKMLAMEARIDHTRNNFPHS